MYQIRLFVGFLAISSSLYAQVPDALRGRVIDAATNASVPFATVKLKNRTQGVISNAEGGFQFPYRYKSQKDTLVISCIGYQNKIVPLDQLEDNSINIIKLETSTTQLAEVVIRARRERKKRLSAFRIVKKAINQIPVNYPQSDFTYEAYYRDYQLKDDRYINLNEAIVEVSDAGFHTNDERSTKIRLHAYRQNAEFQRDTSTAIAYDNSYQKFIPDAKLKSFGGNELTILRIHNAIRNHALHTYSFVYTLAENFIRNHNFKLNDPILLNDVYLYAITCRSIKSKTGSSHFAKGTIYIEPDNFAIHKMVYEVYQRTKPEHKLLFDVQVEYVRRDSSMYLNYISFHNLFNMKNPSDFRVEDIVFDAIDRMFTITFNHWPTSASVLDTDNYKIKILGKKVDVERVTFDGWNGNKIYVFLKENEKVDFIGNREALGEEIQIEFENIKDLEGRILGEETFIVVNQFRELFVQQWGISVPEISDTLYIDKKIPLVQNTVVPQRENSSYWMNTPIFKVKK
ncbi:MAG: carboxypeptidase-like regulatory domain-containing protein [Bacteroidota bacterium]